MPKDPGTNIHKPSTYHCSSMRKCSKHAHTNSTCFVWAFHRYPPCLGMPLQLKSRRCPYFVSRFLLLLHPSRRNAPPDFLHMHRGYFGVVGSFSAQGFFPAQCVCGLGALAWVVAQRSKSVWPDFWTPPDKDEIIFHGHPP